MPANAMTPATIAATTARRRKYSAILGRSRRRASHTRYTAERYAHTVTARMPPRIDVGFIQLCHQSPDFPPAGTRPDAIAPATAPKQYGTITDEIANAAPKFRRSAVRNTTLRNAKLEPRNTMPTAASVSGTNSVSVIAEYAVENAVHNTTKQKISHTWFASHTGPIEWSMSSRGSSPRVAPPAMR